MGDLAAALRAIDAANAADPNHEDGQPAAQLYGIRMSQQVDHLFPAASDLLNIAARGQHIERWTLQRADYPQGRAGYLKWRRDLARHHATRVGEIMETTGYTVDEIETVGRMIRKEGIKRDADVQALEDVICFTFLTWYFTPFAAKHPEDKVLDIVQKTARKMSEPARARVLDEFDLPPPLAAAFAGG